MFRLIPLIAALLGITVLTMTSVSCYDSSRENRKAADPNLSVFVNIPPQAYLAERIGGDAVEVEVLVPPGRNPHDFSPSPRTVMALGGADIYFHGRIPFGLELAAKVKDADTGTKIIDITKGIDYREINESAEHYHDQSEHESESHNHDHDNSPEGKDPHVWLGPPEIKIQAENIAKAFQDAVPERSDKFEKNLATFLTEVDNLDHELEEALAPFQGETFYVYHPSFGYFGRAYDLEQQAVEIGGRSPSPKNLRSLIKQAREENVRVIFTQPQFEGKSAETVAEAIDGTVVPLDPLAYDILDNLSRISEKIKQAMAKDE